MFLRMILFFSCILKEVFMRLILHLRANNSTPQEGVYNKYNTAMHGFIYQKLNETSFGNLHGVKHYKPFCFGNIFPIKDGKIRNGENYKVVITSPDSEFIQGIFFNLQEGEVVNLGEMSFTLEKFFVKMINIGNDSILENITPINITKHDNKSIKPVFFEDKEFLNLLKKNIIKKYNFFNKTKVDKDFDLFDQVEIVPYKKKSKSSFPIYFYNKGKNDSFNVMGSKIVFKLNNISDNQLKIFQFSFDLGFGERTSYGAGFMVERWKRR